MILLLIYVLSSSNPDRVQDSICVYGKIKKCNKDLFDGRYLVITDTIFVGDQRMYNFRRIEYTVIKCFIPDLDTQIEAYAREQEISGAAITLTQKRGRWIITKVR